MKGRLAAAVVSAGALAAVQGAAGAPDARTGGAVADRADAGAARCVVVRTRVRGKARTVRACARSVALRLERGRAGRAVIGRAGGSVSAVESDGTRLTLAIPAGALQADTAITLTPVAGARTPPGVRVVGGAQLGPEGLALARPATLTIVLARGAGRVHGFAWWGMGQDAHRYPLRASGRRLVLRVAHFSGAGAAAGDQAWLARIESALTIRFGRYIRPAIRRAETDDREIESAFNQAFGWQKAVELLGLQARFKTWLEEIRVSYRRALRNAFEKTYERCVERHDLSQLGRLVRIERTAQIAGVPLPEPPALERVDRCGRFELDFDSRIRTAEVNPAHRWEAHGRTRGLPIRIKPDLSGFEGRKSPELVAFSAEFGGGSCTWRVDGHEVRFETMVRELRVEFDPEREGPTPKEISLRFFPGQIVHRLTQVCGSNEFSPSHHDYWASRFLMLHQDEDVAPEPARAWPLVAGWSYVGGGDVWARKEYHRSKSFGDSGTLTEDTTLVLRHTPVR